MWGKTKSIVESNIKNLLFFYERLGSRIFIMIGLTTCVGIMDGMGLTMFLPLFQIAANNRNNSNLVDPTNTAVDSVFQLLRVEINLISILSVMIIFFVIKGGFNFLKSKYDTDTARYFMMSTRRKLLSAFSQIRYEYFVNANVGRVQNVMTGELSTVYIAFTQYISILQQVIMIIVYVTFAMWINPQFASFIIVGGLLFNFVFNKVYKITKLSSRNRVNASNNYQNLVIQFINNFKYLKATGLFGLFSTKVNHSIDSIERESRRMGYMGAIAGAIREPILIIIVSAVILLQTYVFGGSLSTIIISLLFFYRALTAVTFLQTNLNTFNTMVGTLENVEQIEADLRQHKEIHLGGKPLFKLEQHISLENVNFYYSTRHILKDINLNIPAYQTTAIVGESGSGKTTLINVITGVLPIDSGTYKIDGISFSDVNLQSFQHRLGYIPQEAAIFNDTVYNNVTFWSEPTSQNKKRFLEAVKQAAIFDYIENLPEKEQTLLGHNGINLSGGQKQRISIARELFKTAQILLFDEATAALDSETENQIQQYVESLKGKYTIVIVAHRLSTVRHADNIIVMHDGKVLAHGKFEDLMDQSQEFRNMVSFQNLFA